MGGRPPLGETEVPGNHTEVAVRQLQECAKCHCYLFTLKWLIVCEVSFLSIFFKKMMDASTSRPEPPPSAHQVTAARPDSMPTASPTPPPRPQGYLWGRNEVPKGKPRCRKERGPPGRPETARGSLEGVWSLSLPHARPASASPASFSLVSPSAAPAPERNWPPDSEGRDEGPVQLLRRPLGPAAELHQQPGGPAHRWLRAVPQRL